MRKPKERSDLPSRAVRISYRVDYGVRLMTRLAELGAESPDRSVRGAVLAEHDNLPPSSVDDILRLLRNAGLVRSQRGREGGYWLARPADAITIADVVRAVEGPLAHVRGEPPESVHYAPPAEALEQVWIAVRANLRAVVEHVTVADVASGSLPTAIGKLAKDPDAWVTR